MPNADHDLAAVGSARCGFRMVSRIEPRGTESTEANHGKVFMPPEPFVARRSPNLLVVSFLWSVSSVLLAVHFVSERDDSAKASVRPDSRVAPVFDWRIAGHRPAPPLVAALLRLADSCLPAIGLATAGVFVGGISSSHSVAAKPLQAFVVQVEPPHESHRTRRCPAPDRRRPAPRHPGTPRLRARALFAQQRGSGEDPRSASIVAHPDESIDRILKFVDYGHASIGGLTGGLAVAVDDVSMWLAYKLFEISTDGGRPGIEHALYRDGCFEPAAGRRTRHPRRSGAPLARNHGPCLCRLSSRVCAARSPGQRRAGAGARFQGTPRPAVVARIRKNYALDRARYFIPFATRTNLALVQTSRMWAQTVKHLDSLPAARGARGGGGHPRRTGQAVAAAHAPQRRRIVLPGAGAAGTRRFAPARARAPLRRAACRRRLGQGRPGHAAVAAGTPAGRRGPAPPGQPLRAVRLRPSAGCA